MSFSKMKTYFVDAFTSEPFRGNPAAVCFPETLLDETLMQQIATEIGFSETAFVHPISEHEYSIRFFTPKKEIPLCGHATLASARIIFDDSNTFQLCFINIGGIRLDVEKDGDQIKMQFPVYGLENIVVPKPTLDALGIDTIKASAYSANNRIILIEIEGSEKLENLQPDFNALIKSYSGINGVLVTAQAANGLHDFHYRYFWPWAGTNEDPVTGGVQTFLTKYWAEKLHKIRLIAFQSSARTGIMLTEVKGDKVVISGKAIVVMEGMFRL
jgi:PhzF family phenazine biosynthesis protein